MPVTNQSFKRWSKPSRNIKLSSDASVLRLTHEGITNLASLSKFDKKSIQCFPKIYKNIMPAIDVDASNNIRAKDAVAGASMSSISVSRIVAALNAAKYHGSIDRVMNPHNMGYSTVLDIFKIDHDAYLCVKDEVEPNVPKINDRGNYRKIIH